MFLRSFLSLAKSPTSVDILRLSGFASKLQVSLFSLINFHPLSNLFESNSLLKLSGALPFPWYSHAPISGRVPSKGALFPKKSFPPLFSITFPAFIHGELAFSLYPSTVSIPSLLLPGFISLGSVYIPWSSTGSPAVLFPK